MCGIAGILDHSAEAHSTLQHMLDRLAHRGPDDNGTWFDHEAGIAFGHRRLSIIDLSPMGHQPMVSTSGRHVLTYNGEIYNHQEILQELERSGTAPAWRGHSDTEVLLAACETWGVESTLHRCNGMFAFALWDRQTRTLTLARDRMGEKPLYFGWVSGTFAFASELKAFDQLPGWAPRMHLPAISSFLQTGYIRGPESAISGIFRLPPGCVLRLTLDELQEPRDWAWLSTRAMTYWSVANAATTGLAGTLPDDEDETTARLELLLKDAVGLRMAADVPLGTFLSGGIDSSLVTALMQAQSSQPIRSFSIGFREPRFDEAPFARAIARHLGTQHTELYVDANAALDLIPSLADTFDEPFADFSQLPTLLVSKLTRQHVTVALSGDGGDELFGGYQRYFSILKLNRSLQLLSPSMRIAASAACRTASALSSPLSIGGKETGTLPFRLARLAERLATPNIDAMRVSFIGGAGQARITRKGMQLSPETSIPDALHDPLRRLMLGDQTDYLPDDILHKVDRAAMAYALETRVPLLDHRIVELSWRFPTQALVARNQGKQPLRRILGKYVPRTLVNRPKQGFSPPMDTWLRGPLYEWAESRLSEKSLREFTMLDSKEVRAIWSSHSSGRMNAANVLWNVLMLVNWKEQFKVGHP